MVLSRINKNYLYLSLNTPFYLELCDMVINKAMYVSKAGAQHHEQQFWAWLFKTKDIVSKHSVKFSEVNFSNMPIIFVEKM